VGQNLAQRYSDMDMDMMILAMKEAYKGKPCMTDVNTGPMIVNNYTMEVTRQKADANKAQGRKFLDANKSRPGVKSTESGLQYEVLVEGKEGKGEKPGLNDVVKVHYVGTLINGKEFDNSHKRGAPAEFGVGGVIAGWTEALQMMTAGSKYKLYIPSNLAYGDSQMGNEIPPGSTLIFEVELLEIKKNDPPKTAEPKKENGQ
jgi:FKBP-type peptidyl-prolyl cis-trans isomerase